MFFSPTKFASLVARDAIITIAIVIISAVGRRPNADGAITCAGFLWGLLPACLPLACLGLVKFIGTEHGIQFSFLGSPYPPNGSLKLDYNIFGLSALTCGIFAMAMAARGQTKNKWAMLVVTAIFFLSAAAAGSRRILILLPLCGLFFFATLLRERKITAKSIVITVSGILALVVASSKLALLGPIAGLLGTINPDTMLGFLTRSERWKLALDVLAAKSFWKPSGFSYHETFSCRFSSCATVDYPHSPILSEWIILGAVGLILVLTFYTQLVRRLISSTGDILACCISIAGFAALLSSLISGDTLLSHSQLLAIVALYSYVCDATVIHLGRDTNK